MMIKIKYKNNLSWLHSDKVQGDDHVQYALLLNHPAPI